MTRLRASALLAAAITAGSVLGAVDLQAATFVTNFDVAGIQSWGHHGDAQNEVHTRFLAADARVIGIGWDVTIDAIAPSWLSEARISFEDSASNGFLQLAPAVGDAFPGLGSYSSGGIVDLIEFGLDFSVAADGILQLEFFEFFDDHLGDVDATWTAGNVAIQYETDGAAPIPEPSTYALLVVGLATLGFARGRRRPAAGL